MCQTFTMQLHLASINTEDDERWDASCKKLLFDETCCCFIQHIIFVDRETLYCHTKRGLLRKDL